MKLEITETEKKYLDALKGLKNVLAYTNKMSMNDFITKNNLSKEFSIVLKNAGIIEIKGEKNACQWRWLSEVEPNIHMARKVIKESNEIRQTRRLKRKKIKNSQPCKQLQNKEEAKEKIKEVYEKSILWGLFSTKKVVYKK